MTFDDIGCMVGVECGQSLTILYSYPISQFSIHFASPLPFYISVMHAETSNLACSYIDIKSFITESILEALKYYYTIA